MFRLCHTRCTRHIAFFEVTLCDQISPHHFSKEEHMRDKLCIE